MAANLSLPAADLPDKDLALWMLERMRDSAGFLEILRKARAQGRRDVLDTAAYVARHGRRLAKLFQSDTEEDVPAAASAVAAIEEIMRRDLISSPEEFVEKAIEAYIEKHGAKDLPTEWQSTFEAARKEIEGVTRGMFEPGFIATLATAARIEIAREKTAQNARDHEQGRDQ